MRIPLCSDAFQRATTFLMISLQPASQSFFNSEIDKNIDRVEVWDGIWMERELTFRYDEVARRNKRVAGSSTHAKIVLGNFDFVSGGKEF